MTTMTCARFDELLPGLLEGELSSGDRDAAEAHAAACARCGPPLAEMRSIVRDAAALPELEPTRDLWDGIAARIEAPVVELEPRQAPAAARRGLSWRMAAAAAAVLVAVTAWATWQLTVDSNTETPPQRIAATDTPQTMGVPDSEPSSTQVAAAPETTTTTPAARPRSASAPAPVTPVRMAPEAELSQLYDREIASLRRILETRRTELDTATVRVLEDNLTIIDRAIEQSREALARDPNSSFLMNHLNDALGRKVEILRTATLLQARS